MQTQLTTGPEKIPARALEARDSSVSARLIDVIVDHGTRCGPVGVRCRRRGEVKAKPKPKAKANPRPPHMARDAVEAKAFFMMRKVTMLYQGSTKPHLHCFAQRVKALLAAFDDATDDGAVKLAGCVELFERLYNKNVSIDEMVHDESE
eukprot:NODE_10143_length_1374_cov_2.947073.p2 GENE.NODE_10143_length_1374_cov_2.947073~~NODE_10143_length_1374_cov_2.947073.p2  ORF type:complete len:149 (+),score=38.32 NODE_10143_length_1374_cov_2.947073:772-1218(+)